MIEYSTIFPGIKVLDGRRERTYYFCDDWMNDNRDLTSSCLSKSSVSTLDIKSPDASVNFHNKTASKPFGLLKSVNFERSNSPLDPSNMQARGFGSDAIRVSVSSAPSTSSHGSAPDDCDALGNVYIWGEVTAENVRGVGVDKNFSHCAVTVAGELYTWCDGTRNAGLLGPGTDATLTTSTGQLFTFSVLGHGDRENVPREVQSLSGLRTIAVGAECGILPLLLSYNNFYQSDIPHSIESFTNLRYLNLSYSDFVGSIPNELGKLFELQHLDLSNNYLDGAIPWQIENLSKLQSLHLGGNYLVGVIPYQLGNLSMLQTLQLGYNTNLTIARRNNGDAEWIPKLSLLTNLDLGEVSGVGNSKMWMQLMIDKIVPSLTELRLSRCGISYTHNLPLSASHSNYSSSLITLDLSYNNLNSSLFQWPFNFSSSLQQLYLKNCNLSSHNLYFLSSHLHFPSLIVLDLSYNNWNSVTTLNFGSNLQALDLSNCSLTSNNLIFTSFNPNLSSLVHLDLSNNQLTSSTIFYWTSNFTFNLHELDLCYNSLSSSILDGFGNVMKSLEVLDLSNNNLQGEVPTSLGNICTLKSLALVNNNFSGNIPRFISNISWCNRHSLQGEIPFSIGRLVNVEAMVLRNNSLTRELPLSLANCSKLALLDVSENKLSGPIPSWIGSFNASSYGGNHDLCGLPLNKMCPEDNTPPSQEANHDEEEEASLFCQEFYLSMGLGFAVGFWAVVGPLLFNQTWRQAYYRFMNTVTDNVHVMVAVYVVKCLTIRD
ncbi:receptor-like protein EIX1 [Neltuma alba]|uniref:receptor-like protein EIX1 n=1 Tax=Neltuma alba TaxID=207710 RepID=UPI0010A312F3|nr:receptor-like protein EIX1 [Prosopis alba]